MKVVILYRPNSEHATPTESFMRDFKARNPAAKIETVNLDEREGIALASLYDLTSFPAILVLTIDGQAQQVWQGSRLPLIDEVASYLGAGR